MPLLLPPDANRARVLASAAKSNEYLAKHLGDLMTKHAGEFAVVCNGELIVIHKHPDEAKDMAVKQGYKLAECLVVAIPKRGASHYF